MRYPMTGVRGRHFESAYQLAILGANVCLCVIAISQSLNLCKYLIIHKTCRVLLLIMNSGNIFKSYYDYAISVS